MAASGRTFSQSQQSISPGCTWTFSTAELRGIAQLFFSTNTEYYVHHCYSAVLDSAVLNIYKCWNKKNPVKVLNIMYTIVIQHCWIVKNSAQLQKFSAVLDFMYTLVSVNLSFIFPQKISLMDLEPLVAAGAFNEAHFLIKHSKSEKFYKNKTTCFCIRKWLYEVN